MALMTKGDLYFKDYQWKAYAGDNPEVTGEPDSTLFNRHEGYEVLYLINKIAARNVFKQKASGTKLEKMIRYELPSDVRGQERVVNWLENNWDKSKY
ncbi:MAG: hypothetical protein HZB31_04585 [Nitrospirae bacterium]|nr:hypothetical protein [Nitrospirota bacterium]